MTLAAAAFAATSLLIGSTGAACGEIAPTRSVALSPTPTPTATRTAAPVIPSDEFVVYVLNDVTSSAIRFSDEGKRLVAAQLHQLLLPGHGGAQVVAATITSNSFDPINTKFASRFDGLPPKPSKRLSKSLPTTPDLSRCQKNPFNRQGCEATLAGAYQTELHLAFKDESKADEEFQAATSDWQQMFATRTAEVEVLAGQLRDAPLPLDSTGTDVWGALLRASETLSASRAPTKLLLVSSDWLPSGKQQQGDLHFPAGTIVKTIFYDCTESRDCLARKQSWTEMLLAAGVERVLWLDPGASRLQTNLFEEVTH